MWTWKSKNYEKGYSRNTNETFFAHDMLESFGLNLSGRGSEENHLFRLGRRRVRLGPILFTTHKIERRKGRALNSKIKRWLPLEVPLKA